MVLWMFADCESRQRSRHVVCFKASVSPTKPARHSPQLPSPFGWINLDSHAQLHAATNGKGADKVAIPS